MPNEKPAPDQVCAVYCSNWDAVKLGCLVIELDGYANDQGGEEGGLLGEPDDNEGVGRQAQLQGIRGISIANRIPIFTANGAHLHRTEYLVERLPQT